MVTRSAASLLLAIETSGDYLSAALLEKNKHSNPKVLGETLQKSGRNHSDILLDVVAQMLKKAGRKKESLTHLAVSTGPGSFTGLRIGITFARTLSQFMKIPLIGIPVFEIIAADAVKKLPRDAAKICVAIPSIGEDVFAGVFRRGSLSPLFPYAALPLPKLLSRLEKNVKGKISLVGYGFSDDAPRRFEPFIPRARILAELAFERMKKKTAARDSWKKVLPLYIRAPIAVERAGHRKRS